MGDDGNCTGIDNNCKDYDAKSGICLSCYPGYSPSGADSRLCVVVAPQDPNC